jgi:hypothetical protein
MNLVTSRHAVRNAEPPVRLGSEWRGQRRAAAGRRRREHEPRAVVMPKATAAFARKSPVYDTSFGWCFVNPQMDVQYGVDSMPEVLMAHC